MRALEEASGGAVPRLRLKARLLDGVLGALALGTLWRVVSTALGYGAPAWFQEELPPLVRLLTRGEPITQIDSRQYGVVAFLVFDPAVRLLGPDFAALSRYAMVVDLVALAGAFLLVARRYARGDRRRVLALAVFWFNFVPLLYVLAQRMVDAWQLLFVSASLFLFTARGRLRLLAGVPLALATLTKLLPALLLVYLLVREWRAAAIGGLAGLILLGVGQVLYGPLMGLGYPFALLGMGGSTVATWSVQLENNSVRGLVYKLAAGFRLEGEPGRLALPTAWAPGLNLLAYALALALLLHLLVVAWRNRDTDSAERRSLEFSVAVVVMLLVSPHTAQDYTIVMLPVFTALAFLWLQGVPGRWSRWSVGATLVSALLIGVFVPVQVLARTRVLEALFDVTGTVRTPWLAEQMGSGIGAYQFFGFTGLGLLLAWLVLARLERRSGWSATGWRHARTDASTVASSGAASIASHGTRMLRWRTTVPRLVERRASPTRMAAG